MDLEKFFSAPAQHRLNWLIKKLIERGIITKGDLENATEVRSPNKMEKDLVDDIKAGKVSKPSKNI